MTSALSIGDVVQISPEHDERFGGCFMYVTEPKVWGAQGFVQIPAGGRAFYRCPHSAMSYIGKSKWVVEESESVAKDDGENG